MMPNKDAVYESQILIDNIYNEVIDAQAEIDSLMLYINCLTETDISDRTIWILDELSSVHVQRLKTFIDRHKLTII